MSRRDRSNEQVCILVARDRTGATTDWLLDTLSAETVTKALPHTLSHDTLLCSDGHPAYRAFASTAGITHRPINLTKGNRVVDKVFHIQNVNAYHSRLKAWMRHFKGVATRYLTNYLGWFRWIEQKETMATPDQFLLDASGSLSLCLTNT